MKKAFEWLLAFTQIALMTLVSWPSLAQQWQPQKAITLVVPVAPGSSNDMIARLLSERLPPRLGQAVVVDNRPGASGMVGASSVARAAPDGLTILIAPADIYMVPHLTPKAGGANFDVIQDLVPIVNAGTAPLLIVANPSIHVSTPAELLAYLRNGGSSNYASPGLGSPMNIAGDLFTHATGLPLNHVPYKGVLPAVNAVLANEVPLAITALAGAAPFIEAGKLVPIAMVEKQRSPLIPNLPTLTESGIPGVEVSVFFQILAPAHTPAAVMARYNTEINAVLAMPDVRASLMKLGIQPVGGSSVEAAKWARETYERNGKLVKEFHISVE